MKIKSMFLRFGSVIAALALFVANTSVSTTCTYLTYQPDVPEELTPKT